MQNLQSPDSTPVTADSLASTEQDEYSVYDDIQPDNPQFAAPQKTAGSTHQRLSSTHQKIGISAQIPIDAQASYFEKRDPAELVFCIILAAAYAGLAKFCWEPLETSRQWAFFVGVEGLFITIALLSLVLGLRPYVSPSSLQISQHGLKYRGPYWPQRRTVNWDQVFRLFLSQELIVVFYRPVSNPNGIRLLVIQSSYLSDTKGIVDGFTKYAMVRPIYLKNPEWYLKAIFLSGYLSIVCWILWMLQSR